MAAVIKTGKMAVAMTCFAAFGGFLYGYDTGYISGVKEMQPFARNLGVMQPDGTYALSAGTDALVTSILSAGTFVGALLAYPAGDRLGRRFGIIAFLGLFVIGVACQTSAKSLVPFVVGRVFAGFGVGGTSCLVPMYQSECAPKKIRGAVVAAYQWMITIGLLIAAIIVNFTKDIAGESSYQIPIGLQFVWAAILATGLIILPESPRWLVSRGRDEDAQRALARILNQPLDSSEVHQEYAEIAANVHAERARGPVSYIDCFRNGPGRNRLRTWTGIGIQALQQLSGINFIIYYGTTFFQRSGISDSFIITIIINCVNVAFNIPTFWLVDTFGRRSLLLTGAAGMTISQLVVAATGTAVGQDNQAGQKVLVAFVCIFIAFFASTWGPLAWVVTGEIYPNSIRAKAMCMSTASNWLVNFAIGYSTPYLVNTGPGNAGLQSKVFFIWGGCCMLAFAFTFFFIPETKGLSLEQVDILYRNSSILGSNKYRQRILDENIHDEDTDAYRSNKEEAGKVRHLEDHEDSSNDGNTTIGGKNADSKI